MTVRASVAELVAEGFTDKEIAGRLSISQKTVEYHIGKLAADWNLDRQRNLRVQITRHLLAA